MPVEAPGEPTGVRVAMALYGDLSHDSRVIREAESLAAEGYAVTIACLGASPAIMDRLRPSALVVVRRPPNDQGLPGGASPYQVDGPSRVRRAFDRAAWLWRYQRSLAAWGRQIASAVGPADIWHAHDLTGLQAIVPNLPRDVPIVYDSHELFLETGSAVRLPGLARRLLRAREARLVARCVAMITVNPGLAAVLTEMYHPARIEIVRNCVPRWSPPDTRPNLLREALGLAGDAPILLFHGSIEPDRGIERLVAALTAPGLEGLHLVLLGNGEMREALAIRAGAADLAGRLHLIPAVSPAELPGWVASADIGAVLQEPANQNLVLSTPNKLYEAIAVGTPVVASDLPEIARIVRDDPDGPLGLLCDPGDQESIVIALRSLLEPPRTRLLDLRTRCLRAAEARLNWETEATHLTGLYADLSERLRPGATHDGTEADPPRP
jgi:glycosyltransferase involved in cell wall biosynthesis